MRGSGRKWLLTGAVLVIVLLFGDGIWVSELLWKNAGAPTSSGRNPEETVTLSGVVKDETGKPIGGAIVAQGWSPYAADDSYYVAKTDDAGRFDLEGMKPEADLWLTAMASGRSPMVKRGGPEDESFTFVLPAGHVMRFRILDANDKPLVGATVEPTSWMGQDLLRPESKEWRCGGWMRQASGGCG